MVDFEKAVVLGYLHRMLDLHGHQVGIIKEICEYLDANRKLLGDRQSRLEPLIEKLEVAAAGKGLVRAAAVKVREPLNVLLRERIEELAGSPASDLERNIRLLVGHLGLNQVEQDFFGLAIRHRSHGFFNCFLNQITREHLNTLEACAACLSIDIQELAEHLVAQGRLLSSGLLRCNNRSGSDLDDHYQLACRVFNAVHRNTGGLSELLTVILGEPTAPNLCWDDFEHLGAVRERLATLLRRVAGEGRSGVNILLWGAPGTGKTEFCKSLAAHLGLRLYAVGEVDDDGDEPNRKERLTNYRLAQDLLRYSRDTLVLFDEMDDIFEGNSLVHLLGGKGRAGSKVFMNRLLESNPVPALWLINDPSLLEEAFLRRMALVVEVKVPPPSRRERVWQRLLEKNRIELPAESLRQFAELNLSPALIDSAARYTCEVDGNAEDFRFAAEGILQVIRGRRPLAKASREDFLPELTCADLDLADLTDCLCQAPERNLSLCIYGPPGTGKSAYLRYLAERMGMPVLVKRASGLLDMFVGESEKQIAGAFQEAIDSESFLIFDEVDSLLGDRRQAHHNWEVSQVNEMLTWMESHPLPFACTTNLKERLDQASLRRFTFKCCFDYLREEQVAEAFRHFFSMDMPAGGCQGMWSLTPGDFAVVRKKAGVLGRLDDTVTLCRMLREEVSAKGQAAREPRVVGFSTG